MFRLEIETTNAAFSGVDASFGIAKILLKLADDINNDMNPYREASGQLRDINGNTVGTWQYTPEEES